MNYLVLLSRDIIGFICGLASSIFLARHLGPEQYGKYVYVILILSIFQNFGRFRISISILPYLKKNPEHENIIFSTSFFLNGVMGLITSFLIIFIGNIFNLFQDYSIWIYLILSIMIISEFYLTLITYALSYKSKFKLLSLLINFKVITQTFGFAYVYFYINEKSIFLYLVILSISNLVTCLLGLFKIKEFINLSFLYFRKLDLKLYFKSSLRFYLSDAITFFSTKGIATVVAAKLAISNLAFFNMIFSHFELLRFPNNALGSMMYPELSKISRDKKQRKYIFTKLKFNFPVYILVLLGAYFFYPKLVLFFYGPDYNIIIEYFPYVLIIGAPYLIAYPMIHYFSANGAPQYEALIKLISVFIQIISLLIIIFFSELSLLNVILSQSVAFPAFMIALLIVFKYKKFETSLI